jgi:hypothetical protein
MYAIKLSIDLVTPLIRSNKNRQTHEGDLKLYSPAGMSNGSVNAVIEMRGFSSGCP